MHSTIFFEALDRHSDVRHLLRRGSIKSRTYRIQTDRQTLHMVPVQETAAAEEERPARRRLLQGPLLRRVG